MRLSLGRELYSGSGKWGNANWFIIYETPVDDALSYIVKGYNPNFLFLV